MKIQLKTTREQPISGTNENHFACNNLIPFDVAKSFTNLVSSNGPTLAQLTHKLLSSFSLTLFKIINIIPFKLV